MPEEAREVDKTRGSFRWNKLVYVLSPVSVFCDAPLTVASRLSKTDNAQRNIQRDKITETELIQCYT